jgi:protein subunit release factor A
MILRSEDLKTEPFPKMVEGGMNTGQIPVGVKITHIPTGLYAICNSERSMHRNRDIALEKLERIVAGFSA